MNVTQKMKELGGRLFNSLAQDQAHHNPEKTVTPGMPELVRAAAAQGAVLLENRGALPLKPGTRVSVFGRVQVDSFYTGYGSGGDVNAPYRVSLLEGLRECETLTVNEELAQTYEAWCVENPIQDGVWGRWPRFYPEMPVTAELVQQARAVSDQAVIVLGRASGEDRENTLEPGSYFLTEEERAMLTAVKAEFPDAVLVLNIGSVMDLRFLKELDLGGVLLLWQGGMETGNAAADLLSGRVNPSGRLTDTIANTYEDHPSSGHFGEKKANEYWEDIYVGYRWFETFGRERVLYPFGYGLSYTSFRMEDISDGGPLSFRVRVTNTGSRSGREAVLLFLEKPCGVLGNPARELAAFAKTKELAPGESQELEMTVEQEQLTSFDDSGLTGNRSCWVVQPGTYRFYLGENVRDAEAVRALTVDKLVVAERLTEAAAPAAPFPILACQDGQPVTRMAAARTRDLKKAITDALPPDRFQTGDKGYKLKDVKEGRVSLDAFVAQLSLEELEDLSRGGYRMDHPLGPRGNAGIFGGVTEDLRGKGIPPVVTTDGPSGIRLYDSCSLLPIGTLLACSFDTALVEELYAHVGAEMKERGSDVLLAPGLNIHRNPLCGRNFEYYSEDPLVSGKMAAAAVRGIQSQGVSACPKHFACNNQEVNRNKTNVIVSQRALREIYLKGFEICVKEAAPKNLMTSYNQVNGVWSHYHYELVQTVLREEWGYHGNVITDWWMQYAASPEFPRVNGNGYRVRAGVNVLMPGSRSFLDKRERSDGTLLSSYRKEGGITLGELQRNAKDVLRCVMDLKL